MTFKTIFNTAILNDRHIIIDSIEYDVTQGKHCLWIPKLEIKIPWVFNGKIEARFHWERGVHADELRRGVFNDDKQGWDSVTIRSIEMEYLLFDLISHEHMAPNVDGFVYIKNMISKYVKGEMHCDPIGAIGFYIDDANKLAPGDYTFNKFKWEFTDSYRIIASKGALGDLQKDGNVVNGYLIDIRRTIWDMMSLPEGTVGERAIPDDFYKENEEVLRDKVARLGQFPHKQRRSPYQSYILGGKYIEGSRDTLYRFDKMQVEKDLKDKTVVDLGCQIGNMCAECYSRGARHITGIDHEQDYIDCARDLARYNGMQINYQRMDLSDTGKAAEYIRNYYNGLVDIVFLLSMYKHITQACWQLLISFAWKTAYVESNNCPAGYNGGHAMQMEKEMKEKAIIFGWRMQQLGMTEDRSPRCLWRLER